MEADVKAGVRAHDFGPLTPVELRKKLDEYQADTIQLALMKSFPHIASFADVSREDIEEIKKQNFDIAVLGCYIDMATPDSEKRNKQVADFSAALRIAKELGAVCVASETSDCTDRDRESQFERVCETIELILPVAHETGVPIAVEPVIRHTINTPAMVDRLIERFGNDEYLRLIFDPVNLLKDDLSNKTVAFFESYISRYEKKFMAMHVKDIINLERVPLGTGDMASFHPVLASLLTVSIPLIREELPPDSLREDLAFIRRTYSGM